MTMQNKTYEEIPVYSRDMTNDMTENNTANIAPNIAILSFYSFTDIDDPEFLLGKILLFCKKKYLKGTVIIAPEGFNGSIAGDYKNLELFIAELTKLTKSANIISKFNYCNTLPFSRIKVKIKKEIIALKLMIPDIENTKGQYIEPRNWDQFISNKDVILIDTRNNYEIKAGCFKGSVNPDTDTFREFPKWVKENSRLLQDKKIAMCCTGGIRCEKATAYMRSLGYTELYHLKGGILQYLEDTKNVNKTWQGECFVFDDRGAVGEDLAPASGYWVTKGYTAKTISIKIATKADTKAGMKIADNSDIMNNDIEDIIS